jgi:hypothetical protein
MLAWPVYWQEVVELVAVEVVLVADRLQALADPDLIFPHLQTLQQLELVQLVVLLLLQVNFFQLQN